MDFYRDIVVSRWNEILVVRRDEDDLQCIQFQFTEHIIVNII